jgi:hypothetical protein
MKIRSIAVSSLSVVLAMAGCATRPEAITPAAVSATEYASLSCRETNTLLAEKRASLQEAERQQNRAATGDAIGVFLVLLPVGSLIGADNEGVVAQYKCEVLALERAMAGNCR